MQRIDWELKHHYESNEDYSDIYHSGYTMRLFTERAVEDIRTNMNLDVQIGTMYKIEERGTFDYLQSYLTEKDKHYLGLYGDDSWSLYALRNREYWERLYGEGYIEREYPLYGARLWNECRELKRIKN